MNYYEIRHRSPLVMNMKMIRVLSVSIVACCLTAATLAFVSKDGKQYPARSFRLIATETAYSTDGKARLLNVRVRWVKVDGQWKEQAFLAKSGAVRTEVHRQDGHFITDTKGGQQAIAKFYGPPPEFRSPEFLMKHPEFVREESLLGRTTYVHRWESESEYIEQYYSPEVGHIPLKVVMGHSNGKTVIETVQLDFIDVTDEMLDRPDLPIKFDFLETRALAAERQGNQGYADSIRMITKELQKQNK
jgi:hypothetical protein